MAKVLTVHLSTLVGGVATNPRPRAIVAMRARPEKVSIGSFVDESWGGTYRSPFRATRRVGHRDTRVKPTSRALPRVTAAGRSGPCHGAGSGLAIFLDFFLERWRLHVFRLPRKVPFKRILPVRFQFQRF